MTFETTRRYFIAVLTGLFLCCALFGIGWGWLFVPIAVFAVVLVYGSSCIGSQFFMATLCRADSHEKQIALTFDDGPHPEFTLDVLALLEEYGVLATFFVIGNHIHGNEGILKKIDAAGHCIGNHSTTHGFFFDFKTLRGFQAELNQTSELIYNVIGKQVALFRPPYGVLTPQLARAIKRLKYTVIGWSVRSFDTAMPSAQAIAKRVQAQIQPGAIILFHDTSGKTVLALKQTLEFAKDNGYKVVSVEQLLQINAYE